MSRIVSDKTPAANPIPSIAPDALAHARVNGATIPAALVAQYGGGKDARVPSPSQSEVMWDIGPVGQNARCRVCPEPIQRGQLRVRMTYRISHKYSPHLPPNHPNFAMHLQCLLYWPVCFLTEGEQAYRDVRPCKPYVFQDLDEQMNGLEYYPQVREILQVLVQRPDNGTPTAPIYETGTAIKMIQSIQTATTNVKFVPISDAARILHRDVESLKKWCQDEEITHYRTEPQGHYFVDSQSALRASLRHPRPPKRVRSNEQQVEKEIENNVTTPTIDPQTCVCTCQNQSESKTETDSEPSQQLPEPPPKTHKVTLAEQKQRGQRKQQQ
jgi:hypothetical protein